MFLPLPVNSQYSNSVKNWAVFTNETGKPRKSKTSLKWICNRLIILVSMHSSVLHALLARIRNFESSTSWVEKDRGRCTAIRRW